MNENNEKSQYMSNFSTFDQFFSPVCDYSITHMQISLHLTLNRSIYHCCSIYDLPSQWLSLLHNSHSVVVVSEKWEKLKTTSTVITRFRIMYYWPLSVPLSQLSYNYPVIIFIPIIIMFVCASPHAQWTDVEHVDIGINGSLEVVGERPTLS